MFLLAGMPLLTRGRLSVQPVDPRAFDGIRAMGDQGDFEKLTNTPQTKSGTKRKAPSASLEAKSTDSASTADHSEARSAGVKRQLRSSVKVE